MQFESKVSVAGMRLNSTPEDVRSLPYTGDGKVIDGQLVQINDDGETCGDVTAATKNYGVVVFSNIGKSGRSVDNKSEAYIKGDVLPVMVMGRIWVTPSETITAIGKAAKVYAHNTDGTVGQTAADSIEVAGWYYSVPTNADGNAIIHLV